MGRQVVKMQVWSHRLLLGCRSQDRMIQSESFAAAWEIATKKQQEIALTHINNISPISLKYWISDVLASGSLDRLNMIVLRQIASRHQIKNYSRMSKQKLVEHIQSKGVKFDTKNKFGLSEKSSGRDAFNSISFGNSSTPNKHQEEKIPY
ncbi:hypothetical protein LCGC14_1092660 [marine sediment metagenome]|uniref:Rho termination factor-like N-terminal domain-containing protein n=1 Tax=marine sediment metagenome TaxID=412755 RepID=A0A0F9MG83_9ZZZZ